MAEEVVATIDIEADVEEVFAVASDVSSYPEWTEGLESAEILEEDDGLPLRVEMVINAQVKVVRYVLGYEHQPPHQMNWESEPGGDIRSMVGEYRFEPTDAGTRVDYRLELDLGFPVPGFMMRRVSGHIARTALDGLKARVEGS